MADAAKAKPGRLRGIQQQPTPSPADRVSRAMHFHTACASAESGQSDLRAGMPEWMLGEGWLDQAQNRLSRLVTKDRKKNRSSQASRNTCSLGTPFPRSALFLLTSLWKTSDMHKSTEGVHPLVTRWVCRLITGPGDPLRAGGFAWNSERAKKRSSQASWRTCRLGTPFPRSALFLCTSLWETGH